MLSAAEPERMRGPQFHAAWGDEFCAWDRPEEALAMLRLGLQLGHPGGAIARDAVPRCLSAGAATPSTPRVEPGAEGRSPSPMKGEEMGRPRLLLTTTPKPLKALRGVLAEGSCARTHAPTRANAANLAEGFVQDMLDLYGGTRRAAQELEGVVLEAAGALFGHAEMERARALGRNWMLGGGRVPYERAVVAVDPPAGTLSGEGGDACGIVVVARAAGSAWVLEDASVAGLSPLGWAGRVARTADRWAKALDCPVRVVAEANQGGAMVEAVLKSAGVTQPVRRGAGGAGGGADGAGRGRRGWESRQGRCAGVGGDGPDADADGGLATLLLRPGRGVGLAIQVSGSISRAGHGRRRGRRQCGPVPGSGRPRGHAGGRLLSLPSRSSSPRRRHSSRHDPPVRPARNAAARAG